NAMDALEKALDLAAIAVSNATLQGSKDRLRILGGAPLHASPLGRQKDTPRSAIAGVGLAANETPLFQEPEDGSHRVGVRGGPFHDGDLRDPWFASHDTEQHELVRGHAVVQHQGIGPAMKRQIGLAQEHPELVTLRHRDLLFQANSLWSTH